MTDGDTERRSHICVCVCTYRRAAFLRRLLTVLLQQQTNGTFTYSIVVCDNDAEGGGRSVVDELRQGACVEVMYVQEPRKNIALARNKAIEGSVGDYIAFIDDDEFPERDWLMEMLGACEGHGVAGVLGPVRPHFESSPPEWIVRGRFFERPEHQTGRVMSWEECRTGNVLFRRTIVKGLREPFLPEFGNGGEDKDFFMRMSQAGHTFRWCNEGVTYETVPPARWKRSYMLRRAMLRGRNILKHPSGRGGLLMRSAIATPMYALILPIALIRGQHVFMKYSVKLCDHLGRLLAVVGLNPVQER